MFRCDNNFTETNDLTLAIVAEHDAITFTLVLLKEYEHASLSHHMICVFTIKHPTCTTEGVSVQNKLGFCFMYPSLIWSFQVGDKTLGHPYTSLGPLVMWLNM
jgi:hypothetical protein